MWAKELSKEKDIYQLTALVRPEVKEYLEEHFELPQNVHLKTAG